MNSSAVCATWIDPGPNSSGWPQLFRNGISVRVRKHRCVESVDGGHLYRWNFQNVLDGHQRLERGHCRANVGGIGNRRNITSASAAGDTTFAATPPAMSPTV